MTPEWWSFNGQFECHSRIMRFSGSICIRLGRSAGLSVSVIGGGLSFLWRKQQFGRCHRVDVLQARQRCTNFFFEVLRGLRSLVVSLSNNRGEFAYLAFKGRGVSLADLADGHGILGLLFFEVVVHSPSS